MEQSEGRKKHNVIADFLDSARRVLNRINALAKEVYKSVIQFQRFKALLWDN